jgi:hypothetical protein
MILIDSGQEIINREGEGISQEKEAGRGWVCG